MRRHQPLRDQRLGGAERLQHVERRRMEGRRARFLAERRPCLEHRHRNAAAHQIGRRDEADRARAGDRMDAARRYPMAQASASGYSILRNAGLGDDVAVLLDLVGVKLLRLIERQRDGLGAGLREALLARRDRSAPRSVPC